MTDAPRPYEFLETLIDGYKPEGWAIEFGVYSGTSLEMIAKRMPAIGLDSFDGLPEDWREEFPAGMFAIRNPSKIPLVMNAIIVPGLFEDTLPRLVERGLPPIGLVHIDCDLYSSTTTALEWLIDDLKPGVIISFDEYHGYPGHQYHEAKAWAEFVTSYGIKYEILGSGDQERAFRILSIGADE